MSSDVYYEARICPRKIYIFIIIESQYMDQDIYMEVSSSYTYIYLNYSHFTISICLAAFATTTDDVAGHFIMGIPSYRPAFPPVNGRTFCHTQLIRHREQGGGEKLSYPPSHRSLHLAQSKSTTRTSRIVNVKKNICWCSMYLFPFVKDP